MNKQKTFVFNGWVADETIPLYVSRSINVEYGTGKIIQSFEGATFDERDSACGRCTIRKKGDIYMMYPTYDFYEKYRTLFDAGVSLCEVIDLDEI